MARLAVARQRKGRRRAIAAAKVSGLFGATAIVAGVGLFWWSALVPGLAAVVWAGVAFQIWWDAR